jgi:hypothetical protein
MEFQIEPLQNSNVEQPQNVDEPQTGHQFFHLLKMKPVIGGLISILVISLVFFFVGHGSFQEGNVELKIDGPSEIAAGDLATYKVTYNNKNRVSLSGVKLTIIYPQDAIVTREGNILTVSTEIFDLGELGSNGFGEKDLAAYVVGDSGNIKSLRAILTYQPSNIQTEFQKEASLGTTITSLSVPITLVAPPTVINGQNLTYFLDYRNQSQQDLPDLRFQVSYPDSFKPIKYSPNPTSSSTGKSIWDIALLKQGDGSRITIEGSLSGTEKESKTVSVVLQRKITTSSGDIYVDFEKSEASSVIATPLLSTALSLNNTQDYVAHLGDVLRYRIGFSNDNKVDLSGLNLSVVLDGDMYDLSTVISSGFFDGRTNTISWNASNVPELNHLGVNQSAYVEFQVHLKNAFSEGVGARDSFVKASAHIETSDVPPELALDKLSADDQLVTRISTAPTFDQKISLNDMTFGSGGPYPPKVNQKTLFNVHWYLVNPSNDISPAKVTAVLAPGVVWENKARANTSQAQPTYNSRLNTVTWDLGTLPAGSGVNLPQLEGNFQISITPSINQVGQAVTLLRNVRFDGTDTFTKEKIARTIPDATTDRMSDSSARGEVQQ